MRTETIKVENERLGAGLRTIGTLADEWDEAFNVGDAIVPAIPNDLLRAALSELTKEPQ